MAPSVTARESADGRAPSAASQTLRKMTNSSGTMRASEPTLFMMLSRFTTASVSRAIAWPPTNSTFKRRTRLVVFRLAPVVRRRRPDGSFQLLKPTEQCPGERRVVGRTCGFRDQQAAPAVRRDETVVPHGQPGLCTPELFTQEFEDAERILLNQRPAWPDPAASRSRLSDIAFSMPAG